MLKALFAAAMLLAGLLPAHAASIALVSMQYSAAQPVPHIKYDGDTTIGDVETLKTLYDNFVKCRIECMPAQGGSTAVLTLNGPGGSYGTGLALADFLRANHIATVVERGSVCYSACAFAFLGGSGYASDDRTQTYIDRQIEPGAIVGFHAPYRDEASFLQALEERGAGEMMGESRDSLSLMVKELVKWNVDPEILSYMVGMGPNQTYDVLTAADYYLIRAALPPTPTSSWITDLPTAVKNACLRLLAIDERADPRDLWNAIDVPWQDNIGTDGTFGTVSGFHWSDRVLDIGSCAITDASRVTDDAAYQISLYFTPNMDKTISSGTTFFNNPKGWSTAGPRGIPTKRILQKGAMNHYFLPLNVPIDDLDLPGEIAIMQNRFFTAFPPAFATMDPRLEVFSSTTTQRTSHIGDVWVFEQTGPRLLMESAVAAPGNGVSYSNDVSAETGFVRDGVYADGTPFTWFGFANGDASTVVRVIVVKAPGVEVTSEERALLNEIQCAADFQGLKLACG